MKEIKLKNGQILNVAPVIMEDAQELADYANKIKTESKFISMDERDGLSTANSQTKWIEGTVTSNKFIFKATINEKIVQIVPYPNMSGKVPLLSKNKSNGEIANKYKIKQ